MSDTHHPFGNPGGCMVSDPPRYSLESGDDGILFRVGQARATRQTQSRVEEFRSHGPPTDTALAKHRLKMHRLPYRARFDVA
jgi:hypothetical protein